MQVFRIDLTSWTASFRYPNMISGFQPSLRMPPISTIWGLISAAVGEIVPPTASAFAYVFRYESVAMDLETIYQIQGDKVKPTLIAKSNVMRREFLAFASLALYLRSERLAQAFQAPYFPLLLGRSNDLASVRGIQQLELQSRESLNLGGTVVPFLGHRLAAPIQALPTHFTADFPRRNRGTQPFYMLDWQRRGNYRLQQAGWLDPETETDLFWYEPEFFREKEKGRTI
jgi:CRISPR-associated protein Cas5t